MNTRLALTRFLASRLDPVFKKEVLEKKKRLVTILLGQSPLSTLLAVMGVGNTEDDDVLATVGRLLPDYTPLLKKAFTRLGSFDITYDVNFHPLVRKELHRLDPEEPEYTGPDGLVHWQPERVANTDYTSVASQIRIVMNNVAAELVYSLVAKNSASQLKLFDTLYYAVKEFTDQILWSDQVKQELRRLLSENRRQLWADSYAERDAVERVIQTITRSVNSLNGIVAQLPA